MSLRRNLGVTLSALALSLASGPFVAPVSAEGGKPTIAAGQTCSSKDKLNGKPMKWRVFTSDQDGRLKVRSYWSPTHARDCYVAFCEGSRGNFHVHVRVKNFKTGKVRTTKRTISNATRVGGWTVSDASGSVTVYGNCNPERRGYDVGVMGVLPTR